MKPTNSLVNAMLTDLYQLTMAYGYWKSGIHEQKAVFDLFFRKNPFGGEYTLFAGLEEVLRYISHFSFSDDDIRYLRDGFFHSRDALAEAFEAGLEDGYVRKSGQAFQQRQWDDRGRECWIDVEPPASGSRVEPILKGCDPAFFEWLRFIDCSEVKVYAPREGTAVFPRVPLLRVEGPLAIVQLLETTLLNLVNYACLVATKAARLRLEAGDDKRLLEFGLRRAQGPDGAFSASRYTYIGGFDSTSNVLAGKLLGIPVSGTHAHSFVSSFSSIEGLKERTLADTGGALHDFAERALLYRERSGFGETNEGELAAFISYARAFPDTFLALVDTYDTLKSGVPNFLSVALALMDLGYKPRGVRIDSGDLAYYSKQTRELFRKTGEIHGRDLGSFVIVASNDINEATLASLNTQGHEINVFGIGTHLVTCYEQPALGGVYKLVLIDGRPRMKLSQDVSKVTIPGRKDTYRLIGKEGYPVLDLMVQADEAAPLEGERILCRHPFDEKKRVYVVPQKVMPLYRCIWEGKRTMPPDPLNDIRTYARGQVRMMREDHLRLVNPAPYKVSVSDRLYHFIHDLWLKEAPITELQ
jgi:nicotinate phosphoribosyltransferase